jgi:hypothetical protein
LSRAVLSALLLALLALGGARRTRADEGPPQEPAPPWLFFPEPDEATAALIQQVVENTSADLSQIAAGREVLVRRVGLWSVPRLVFEVRQASDEPATWNAALTLSALRDVKGAAVELLPAVEPLANLALEGREEWRRAFALLALGSFHGSASFGRERWHKDPLRKADPVAEARRVFNDKAVHAMTVGLRDDSIAVRVAACYALAKTGGQDARNRLIQGVPAKEAAVEPKLAFLLALGLHPPRRGERDDERFLEALQSEERRERAHAALGGALQALSDEPPEWTGRPERFLQALKAPRMDLHMEDGAEAVFARGMLAWRRQDEAEWRDLYEIAIDAPSELATAVAASQCLLFCDLDWFRAEAAKQAASGPQKLKAPVLAMFLLRAGASGTREGIEACRKYLGNPGQTPRGDEAWDVRYHAVVGLLRALAEGRPRDPVLRQAVVEALEAAVARGLPREAPCRAALEGILAAERAPILASADHRVSEARVREFEGAFRCSYAFLAREPQDVAIQRLNERVRRSFTIQDVKVVPGQPDKSRIPQRFLDRYLEPYPYFSRLDLLAERGRRGDEAMIVENPSKGLDK